MDIPRLKELIPVPKEVREAAERGNLVLFVGSGVSQRMGLPSWAEFAEAGFKKLVHKKIIDDNVYDALEHLENRQLLSIAAILDPTLDFTSFFKKTKGSKSDIYDNLNSIGCTFVTTNYDEYLEPTAAESGSGDNTKPEGKRIVSRDDLYPFQLDEIGNVVHLHGAITDPGTMIITTEQYLSHYDHESVKFFLEHLFESKTVVFLGYGLAETELLEHILRRRSARNTGAQKSKQRKLFSLEGFCSSQATLYEYLYKYHENTFGLHLLGYLMDEKQYACLDRIVAEWAQSITVGPMSLSQHANYIEDVLDE